LNLHDTPVHHICGGYLLLFGSKFIHQFKTGAVVLVW